MVAASDPQASTSNGAAPGVPAWLQTVVVVATVVAVGWFVGQGVQEAQRGPERVTRDLLRVVPRASTPVAFSLPNLDGQLRSLTDYPGKVVLLNFWATWCPPCVEEMPSMKRLNARLKADPRFVLLAVSADEDWAPVRKFFGDEKPEFEVLLDAGGEVARSYGTTMFPETYVVKDGKVIGFIEGPRDWDDWFAAGYLEAVLGPRT